MAKCGLFWVFFFGDLAKPREVIYVVTLFKGMMICILCVYKYIHIYIVYTHKYILHVLSLVIDSWLHTHVYIYIHSMIFLWTDDKEYPERVE